MKNLLFCFLLFSLMSFNSFSQKATIHEEMMEMDTYMFSDPSPEPNIGRIYPYFYFHGYTNNPEKKEWKMVVLENDYIKVFVCPDIGGKVWGAIEKSTGEEFLYYNNVVKFRDVAMRGAWTSGGLEFNFGDIGHIPTCATPVDYVMKNNADGSVSCIVGAIDLPSGTKWNVEISVYPDKAYFETLVKWFNNTPLPNTYYHWMNAAAKSSGNLEFIYPGSNWIGHGEEVGSWPKADGRELNYYEKNNFGSYKSYHVMNAYSDFFGGYYHDDEFGFGHLSEFDEKPGKKLWIWGLSEQGMIWEDLLTDEDGQYIEFQAGKLFNQAAEASTNTPFKHREFAAHDTDVMRELWFPVVGTKGMVGASEYGTLNVEEAGDKFEVVFQALQFVSDKLVLEDENGARIVKDLDLKPLENKKFDYIPNGDFKISLLSGELLYSSKVEDNQTLRPLKLNPDVNWESAYGLFTKATELEKQRNFDEAEKVYSDVIKLDKGFLPALSKLALSEYRKMNYSASLNYLKEALSIDTYHPESNYLYGLVNRKLGKIDESKSGFSISAASTEFRTASYTELSKIFLNEGDFLKSMDYARKALSYNTSNLAAYQLMAVSLRKIGRPDRHEQMVQLLKELDGTNHFVNYEKYIIDGGEAGKIRFIERVSNELPHESFLDLAVFYSDIGCYAEAAELLQAGPDNVVADIWLTKLDPDNKQLYLDKIINADVKMVFPHRNETAEILAEMVNQNKSWKLRYYLGLIYWNRGLVEKAKILFEECGDDPDESVFYMAYAKLLKDGKSKEEALVKAWEIEESDWRPAVNLAEFYIAEDRPSESLPLLKKFLEKYPEQSKIGLTLVKGLMVMENYEEAVEFLEDYTVLPFEGATVGRDLYHEACVKLSEKYLKEKAYKKALVYAEKALEWPVNLGVGRPYDVDESKERELIDKAKEGLGR